MSFENPRTYMKKRKVTEPYKEKVKEGREQTGKCFLPEKGSVDNYGSIIL